MSDASRRTVRTALALVVGIAAGLPLLVHTAGIPNTVPGLSTVLAVAAAVTRLLASPVVDQLLPSWLRMAPPAAPPSLALTVQGSVPSERDLRDALERQMHRLGQVPPSDPPEAA
jgi:hypothetical protein